jgi:hypothetical protein
MKITNGTSGAIVASLLLLLSSGDNNEVTARQGQPEEPEQESPSPRKASSKTKMNLRHHNRELRGVEVVLSQRIITTTIPMTTEKKTYQKLQYHQHPMFDVYLFLNRKRFFHTTAPFLDSILYV